MRTIHKFDVAIGGEVTHWLPADAKVVHAAMQKGIPCIWVELEAYNRRRAYRKFRVFGTGEAIPTGVSHVGTFFDGPFVWHVYEQREEAVVERD